MNTAKRDPDAMKDVFINMFRLKLKIVEMIL